MKRSLAAIFVLLLVCTVSAEGQSWIQVSSDHFLLFTDTTEIKGRRLATDLENRVAAFSQVFGTVPERQFPIEVFLFNKETDFLQTLPRPKPEERQDKAAYLLRGPDRIFIVAKDKSADDILDDVGHSLGHVLFERYVMWRPFWLAEGAAEYFRKVGAKVDGKTFAEKELFPVSDLVSIVPSSTYEDSKPEGAFRTLSYRLVRILAAENPRGLREYVVALGKETSGMPKFFLETGPLEPLLKSYAESVLRPPAATPAIKAIEAPPYNLAIHYGDLLLAAGHTSDAARYYNGDTKESRAARAILTKFSAGGLEGARVLARAVREVPDNGLLQYHFGSLSTAKKEDLDAQAAALERCIQVLPRFGRAYAELARVYALTGAADKSPPLLARALELEPEYADHIYEIRADVNIALQRFDAAFSDIQIAEALPHFEKSQNEHFSLSVMSVRKRIEGARRELEDRSVQRLRRQVDAEVARREPPPAPKAAPAAIPPGRISYQIEARAPIEVMDSIFPDYPEELRRSGVGGSITLQVVVGPDGSPKTVTVATSTLPRLNAATIDAVKKWLFKPGSRTIKLIIDYALQ